MAEPAETVSFWRRFLRWGQSDPVARGQDSEAERRVWIRFPSKLDKSQSAITCEKERIAVKVRNISRGGINLLTNRRFEPGSLLSVELPGPTEQAPFTVLAYVVHVTDQGDNSWAIGCSFACELADEELGSLGAKRKRAEAPDNRAWKRFPCAVKGSYQLPTEPDQGQAAAEILNISASGVGLLADRSIDTGTLLNVTLQGPSGQAIRPMLACVVHVLQQDDSRWAVGCNFIRELSDKEFSALL